MGSRRGQIKQIFTYLATIFVIGAVALVGAELLFGIMDQKTQVDHITFKENLKSEIEENNVYGTVNERTFSMPGEMTRLCLVDAELFTSEQLNTQFNADTGSDTVDRFIEDSVEDDVKTNLFLTDGKYVIPAGYSKKLETSDDMVCVNSSNGRVELSFKGQGRTTLVTGQ